MALKDVLKDMEGYQEIADEIEVLRKYGSDYSSSKGVVEHIISLLHPKRITLKLSEVIQGDEFQQDLQVCGKRWLSAALPGRPVCQHLRGCGRNKDKQALQHIFGTHAAGIL